MSFPSPTAAFTKAEMDPFIKEVWSPIIHDLKQANMSILNFATDLSYLLEDGGSVINVPNIYTNVFTVQTQSVEGAGVVDESPAPANVTLTVDTHKYIAFVIGKKTMKQIAKFYPLNEKYATQARDLLVAAVETSLFALVSSLTTTDIGDGLTAVTDLMIRQAINTTQKTDGSVFELSKMAFFWHPTTYWNQILGIAKYYDKSKSGSAPVKDGNFGGASVSESYMGRIYTIPNYVSPRVPLAATVISNMLLHEEAFGFAFHTDGQNGVDVATDYLLQNLAWLTVVDIIYGVGVLRAGAGVTILSDELETVNS